MKKWELRLAKTQRDDLRELSRRLSDDMLDQLWRISQQSSERDGYPSRTIPDGGSRGTDDMSSTERAVSGLGYEQELVDGVASKVLAIQNLLDEASKHAQGITGKLDELANLQATKETDTLGAGDCRACGRYVSGSLIDRLRSGYCDACRKAWARAGFPDRTTWEQKRRGEGEQTA